MAVLSAAQAFYAIVYQWSLAIACISSSRYASCMVLALDAYERHEGDSLLPGVAQRLDFCHPTIVFAN